MSDSVTPWTIARQAPLSMRFFRQEYWRGLPFPSPGDLPVPGIEHMLPVSPALQVNSLTAEPLEKLHSHPGNFSIYHSIQHGGGAKEAFQ